MATFPDVEPKRMYSWWWNSHISPKNSKWLQENLTDMDVKVKAMIKLINEDADSFARRAEMYYKKRPELMKLVEEFYRAYRALAERYDNATGVIRQAHRTMAEVFPNQVLSVPVDDSPTHFASEADPCTPKISPPVRTLFVPDDLQKDDLGLSSHHSYRSKGNGSSTDRSDFLPSRKGSRQLDDLLGTRGFAKFAEGRIRKELNFQEADDREHNVQNDENSSSITPAFSEPEQEGKPEKEIILLKETISKLEAEKEASLLQYNKCLEELSKLESKVSRFQEDSRGHSERASKAEVQGQTLKEALLKAEAEKEDRLVQYQQYLERISHLEDVISHSHEDAAELNKRASRAETKSQFLKEELDKVKIEQDAALNQYKQCLEMISTLEHKLEHAEEDATKSCDRAEKAESEIENLKHAMAELTKEKEALLLQYQQCVETVSSLECKLSCSQEDAQRLTSEIEIRILKLKSAEDRCLLLERSNQSLHSELESLVLKMGSQSHELEEKQQELGRIWTCIQEQHLRFMEAETAFQTLQHLHNHAQEELRSMGTEIQSKTQILKEMETRNQNLQDEILKTKQENKSLNELNLSSTLSIKDMQNEIFMLMETKGKLEQEVELRVDQRNALQQEIYCLKEELNELNKKHQGILEQVDAVGLNANCFQSSVKELMDEHTNLKKLCQSEKTEKEVLLKKVESFEQLLEKNAFLENSISDLSAELEEVRGKVKALEESYQSLLGEKSVLSDKKTALTTQLQITTGNLAKLSEKNTILENSLSDVQDELEEFKEKLKILEDSCQVLVNQNAHLAGEKDTLSSQLDIALHTLEEMEKRCAELQEKFLSLEEEKESTLSRVLELQVSLDAEKKEHANFAQVSEKQFADMESQIHLLQEEGQCKKRESEEALDKDLDSQMEIFILQRCAQDLGMKNCSLLVECQKLLEASKLSEKLISELEKENVEQQMEIKSLFDQTNTLTTGMYQLLKTLDIVVDHGCKDKIVVDKFYLDHMLRKVEDNKDSLCQTDEENQQLVVEMSVIFTLLRQLRLELENLEMERNIIKKDFRSETKKYLALQSEVVKLNEVNEDLRLQMRDRDCTDKVLMIQLENLQGKLLDTQEAYQNLQKEKFEVLEEKKSFGKECLLLEEKNHKLEEENNVMLGEIFSLGNLAMIFKNYRDEKSRELTELHNDVDKLSSVNAIVLETLSSTKRKLEEVNMENLNLKETFWKLEDELKILESVRDKLSCGIADGKNLLQVKEVELLEAEKKLDIKENEMLLLQKIVEDMKQECADIKMIKDDHTNQIFKLSEENDCLREENVRLCESSKHLGFELQHLHEENETLITQVQNLHFELKKKRNEVESWEKQAVASFGKLQMSTICQAVFEEKVHELTRACESLEETSTSKAMDIELLKESAGTLKEENERIKVRLAVYRPAINSLRDFISFFEKNTCFLINQQNSSNEKAKDSKFASLHQDDLSKNHNAIMCDELSDLKYLQTRIKSIEEVMRKNVEATFETSETKNRLTTKDIVLDQTSEYSSYGISNRQAAKDDTRMLELWDTRSEDGSFDITVGKAKKGITVPFSKDTDYQQVEAADKQNDGHHTSDILDEGYSLNQLEISVDSSIEGNKKKVLERLQSDIQKLTSIEITVQGLKRKLDGTEKSMKGKAIVERDALKGQLEEAEETILKLFNVNGKLMKNSEDISFSDKKNATELEDHESLKKRRILEQARRLSEKIGRLQLEVQKIQFAMLKIDDGKESKGRNRIKGFRKRALLQDYLYGGIRTSHGQKKVPFCACIQPPTRGD